MSNIILDDFYDLYNKLPISLTANTSEYRKYCDAIDDFFLSCGIYYSSDESNANNPEKYEMCDTTIRKVLRQLVKDYAVFYITKYKFPNYIIRIVFDNPSDASKPTRAKFNIAYTSTKNEMTATLLYNEQPHIKYYFYKH